MVLRGLFYWLVIVYSYDIHGMQSSGVLVCDPILNECLGRSTSGTLIEHDVYRSTGQFLEKTPSVSMVETVRREGQRTASMVEADLTRVAE